jgi:2-polyprenyl-3-methyl-5-hydroxy-6-metoxy-1,4-benzoquinol methylase
MDLKEEAALGSAIDKHWYYLSKARMAAYHVPDKMFRILDVGAGAGWFSRWFLRHGFSSEATCVDPGYSSDREESVEGRPLHFRRFIERSDAEVVLLMDVLEHVDDDVELLSSYARDAAPGTLFLITVPAFNFLWSAHDDFLEHRRRYTLSSLRKVVKASGLVEVDSHYYFASILPAAIVVRLLRRNSSADRSDMKPVPGWINSLLIWTLAVERVWMRINRVGGLSVVFLGEKRSSI